jgi:hypothetical protein
VLLKEDWMRENLPPIEEEWPTHSMWLLTDGIDFIFHSYGLSIKNAVRNLEHIHGATGSMGT